MKGGCAAKRIAVHPSLVSLARAAPAANEAFRCTYDLYRILGRNSPASGYAFLTIIKAARHGWLRRFYTGKARKKIDNAVEICYNNMKTSAHHKELKQCG